MKMISKQSITPQQLLKKHFGYDGFREGQEEIVSSIVSKNDTLAILPTGGGKSICFQIPALFLEGTTIVASPLISLMKDQVDALSKRRIPATYLNSTLSNSELKERLDKIAKNHYKLVYVAPERLLSNSFLSACEKIMITLVAIDEAHCISMWGHDFRPSYKNIAKFVDVISIQKTRPTIAAFTATATQLVQDEIISFLKIGSHQKFIHSFKRDNLILTTTTCITHHQKIVTMLRILKKHSGEAGIIYVSTRNSAEDVCNLISNLDFKKTLRILPYHGGMTSDERTNVQELFLEDKVDIIVATNAFGMGVDKSNIRFVIHYQLPANIENYYQEAGRAGRDRKLAHCYLLYRQEDTAIHLQLLSNTHPNKKSPRYTLGIEKLKQMVRYIKTDECKTQYIMQYFDEKNTTSCVTHCNGCTKSIIEATHIEKERFSYLRRKIFSLSKKNDIPPQQIMTKKIIELISLLQPTTKQDFLFIPGIGVGWIDQWYATISCYEKQSNDNNPISK